VAFCPLFEELEGLSLDKLVDDYGAQIMIQAERCGGSPQMVIKIGGTEVSRQDITVDEPIGFYISDDSDDGDE